MTKRTTITAIICICLMCCVDTTTATGTGYFYEHPISPFNSPSFSTLPSTGPYNGIAFGSKVVQTSTRPRVTVPPLPSLPPLTSLLTTPSTSLQATTNPRAQSSPTTYTRPYQKQQQRQQIQQGTQQPQQTQPNQKQSPYSQVPVKTSNQPQQQFPNSLQPRIAPQSPPRSTTLRPIPRPTTIPTQRPTPRPVSTTTPRPVASQRPPASPPSTIPKRPSPFTVPTTAVSAIVSISNPNQTGIPSDGLFTAGDFYVLNGRQLKQYKVYEEIDNDISQQVENFIPANFFVNSYHAKIGPTHPLGEDFQLQTRFSGQTNQPRLRVQQQQQQQQQQRKQQVPNTVALGSGGLGFVKLPNGNVYLGSGSLGYISNWQRNQDVANARTRTGAFRPDAVHFGHGPLSDSFYY